MTGLIDRLDFKYRTEEATTGVPRMVVVEITPKRSWRIGAQIFFARPNKKDDVVFQTEKLHLKEKTRVKIDAEEIQDGEFLMRVFSYGPLGLWGSAEGEVKIPGQGEMM